MTDKDAEVSIRVTREDLSFEQSDLDREAAEEGFRRRLFTDPFLDRAAIQRKMADFLIHKDVLMLHGSAIALLEHFFCDPAVYEDEKEETP